MTDGRQILMAMFQGGGNIPLLLPIVARLVASGHRVRVLVGPGVRRSRLPVSESLWRSLHGTGAEILRLREPEVHPWDAAPSAEGLLCGWIPRAFRSVAQEARAQVWLPHWADAVATELRRAPTDVLVADFVLVGALVAAEAVGVPTVVLFHNVYPRPIPGRPPYGPGWAPGVGLRGRLRDAIGTVMTHRLYAQTALPALNHARRQVGLSALREYFAQYDRAARVVVLTSPHFDYPTPRMPPNVRLVGTPLDEAATTPWDPPWSAVERQPRLLVSLSTLPQGQAPLMERLLTALAGLPVRAIVTLGPALAASQFPTPPNVILETFVPHTAVLPHVDAMVTQCGLGTLMKAPAHGVPLVYIPVLGDQPDNAARVVARGAGLRVPADAALGRMREAIQRVVTDPSFRHAARQLATHMAGEDPVRAAVDEIIAVTAKRPERAAG
jgi:MGT family glycosyltransferase